MKNLSHWIYGALSLLFVIVTAALFYLTNQNFKDIPAWVQAVGSVLAIAAVFWIAEFNREKEQRSRNQSVLAVARVAHDFIKEVDTELQTILTSKACGFDGSNIRSIYHRDIALRYGNALTNVPLHELGSPEAVKALLALQVQFSVFFPDAMDRLLKGPDRIAPHNDTDTQARLFEKFIQRKIPTMRPQFKKIATDCMTVEKALS